jgi:hypothetical protein
MYLRAVHNCSEKTAGHMIESRENHVNYKKQSTHITYLAQNQLLRNVADQNFTVNSANGLHFVVSARN